MLCAGLIMNWLGREVTQILNSAEAVINSPEQVFEALERVFRPKSNQTLARVKFRKTKQRVSQTCDSYMSELRLALPECKYKNYTDELLKDQFIFGIENKEIQDHLLVEITIVIIVDVPIVRVNVLHLEKFATDVVRRTTLRKNADKSQASLIDIRVSRPNLARKTHILIDVRYRK